ncbi:4-(cytidine 5'-diphospho)-2-C-methyl-D-erythritol kinase [uncultured Oscillibacter sp.]|uniref:4-(cytidine 5'-diphospho)-2-C-methyl-D-erythritol kinase n=1 Tax=uncultured Oscillibacter sp. TaxID=876091 RepID=UPI0025F0EFEE|nr:4-(cytidine 5'-diphospho)-2-C-methyl-D-erythritol kinase [uncultured Oscillibacter sp.]
MKQTRTAPCKVNLALDILGRREDGYHDLRMVMQTVSLCDTVTVEERGTGFALHTGGTFLPAGRKSLEQRAAEAFYAFLGRPMPGLAVTLEKRVPAYAGLGGGSADVAALLRLLRRAYCPELSTADLERIGFAVGSDMPFCVRGGTALAEGRGEVLTDLAPLPPCHLVLCKPDFGIPTPELFARVDGGELSRRPDTGGMAAALAAGDLAGVAARLGNVFEEVLPAEYGAVFAIKDRLRELGAMNAAMSGSGPTVFGLFREEAAAARAAETLRRTYAQTFLARPVGRLDEEEN